MHLSCTVMEIWRLKDNWVTILTFWSHVTSSVIRLPGVDFLWVVLSDHTSLWHRYGDRAPQILDAQTWTWKERWKKGKSKRKGEGKEKERKSGRGKGKESRRRKGMVFKGKGKEKGKRKERWKKDSLRKVGRTDAWTHGHYSVQCYALHRTDNNHYRHVVIVVSQVDLVATPIYCPSSRRLTPGRSTEYVFSSSAPYSRPPDSVCGGRGVIQLAAYETPSPRTLALPCVGGSEAGGTPSCGVGAATEGKQPGQETITGKQAQRRGLVASRT